MSYRGFKRLLGETGLERKCRYLLGTGVVVLMSASFYVYAWQTENRAYDQLQNTGHALAAQVVARVHQRADVRDDLDRIQRMAEEDQPADRGGYTYRLFSLLPGRPDHQPPAEELAVVQEFQRDPDKADAAVVREASYTYTYYGAVRAGRRCVECHADAARMSAGGGKAVPDLKPGDLVAVVSVTMPTRLIETGFHKNRALLIAFAFGTTALILAGSYLIIRYVIVKPVQHLKDVSDAIAGGELNVRSEIQTGDEFEDLSIAFNRMLRNLISMQERNKGLITDLDRKVDELARVNMALYTSNKLKGDFLSTMSHELRTPLNSIIGFSEVLANADGLTDKQRRYATNIMTGGQQLLSLINDILDLAKAESGKMRLHPEPVHPGELLEEAAALYKPPAEKKNVELRVTPAGDLPPVKQDAGKLRQILGNLVSNAIKFTPQGGRVTLAAAVSADALTLTVADTGVGIAPEEQDLIFDKFRQSANPLTREQGGTGLGLSIVRELAKLLGGDVSVHSELGRGSTFAVRVAADLKVEPLLAFDLPDDPPPRPL